jgi:tetratricopeptide (TPR) repeat protein
LKSKNNGLVLSRVVFLFSLLFFSLSLMTSCATTVSEKKNVSENGPRELTERAQVFYEYREYDKALVEYQKLISLYSSQKDRYEKDLAWAYYEVGFCELQLGRKVKAREAFLKVINEYSPLAPKTLAQQRLEEISGVSSPQ